MKYFENANTVEELKSRFFKLAKELHPDNGGNAAEFSAMRSEYEKLFERLKNVHASADGSTYTKETTEVPQEFADIIEKIIMFGNVKIEIIGSWIWCSGNTYPYATEFRKLGFLYSRSKRAWFYKGADAHKTRRAYCKTLDKVRERYGSEVIKNKERECIA